MAKSADAFRTISEVADWLETPAHVLRFWESKFAQVKPVKRAGGRRYYRPSDMLLLGGIKKLLHSDGMTIKGVQKLLRESGVKHVSGFSQPLDDLTTAEAEDAAIDLTAESVTPPTETVVNFKREESGIPITEGPSTAEAPAEKTPEPDTEAEPDTPTAAEPVEEAATEAEVQAEEADAPEQEEAPAPEAEPEPETAPEAMPAFSHRAPVDESQEAMDDAPTQDNTPPAPKPRKIDVPDDPADDVSAEPGVLSQVATLQVPLSDDMADRLGHVLERLRRSRGGNGQGQGN